MLLTSLVETSVYILSQSFLGRTRWQCLKWKNISETIMELEVNRIQPRGTLLCFALKTHPVAALLYNRFTWRRISKPNNFRKDTSNGQLQTWFSSSVIMNSCILLQHIAAVILGSQSASEHLMKCALQHLWQIENSNSPGVPLTSVAACMVWETHISKEYRIRIKQWNIFYAIPSIYFPQKKFKKRKRKEKGKQFRLSGVSLCSIFGGGSDCLFEG